MLTPQQAAAKLGAGIRNGQQAYTTGVNAVTQSPTAKAADKRAKWVAAMSNPEVHDRWENGLRNTTLAEWKSAAAGVGAQRYSQSADKAQTKYQEFAADFFPFLQQQMDTVNAMPDITQEERIQKAVAMMRALATYSAP